MLECRREREGDKGIEGARKLKMGQAWWETRENGRTRRYKMEKQLREEK